MRLGADGRTYAATERVLDWRELQAVRRVQVAWGAVKRCPACAVVLPVAAFAGYGATCCRTCAEGLAA